MLLEYADGHRECVGQFRHDWVAEPVLVDEADMLYISSGRVKGNWAYVAAVTTQALESQAEGSRLDVTHAGTLEWWFSSQQSILYYGNTRLN